MKKSQTKLGFILSVTVIGALFFNKYIIKSRLTYPSSFINFESYLFAEAENLGGLMEQIKKFNRLASENAKLQQGQDLIISLRAKIDNLENENDFLRQAAQVVRKLNHSVIYAGIFNLNLAPAGYNVLLNKGSRDGISEGDVVITAQGVLVGKVKTVMQNFSRVLFVSDPEFKVTAKVIGSGTSGIARGALNEGIYLDFVVQGDEIKEGDMIMSTGSDEFPPTLIIGSVERIDANTTQTFKKVNIRPAVKDVKLSRVLVIKMQ